MKHHMIYDFLTHAAIVIDNEFIQKLKENGIDLNEYKPTFPPIVDMNKNRYFQFGVDHAYTKTTFCGKIVLRDIKIHDIDFLTDKFNEEIEFHAKNFASIIKNHPHSDLVFSAMPDCPPFPCVMTCDNHDYFKYRAYIGADLMSNKYTLLFEFDSLFVDRIRETNKDVFVPTSEMNAEELKLYDKQPSRNEHVA